MQEIRTVRPHRYANYNFENPPLLALAAERLIAPLLGPGRFSRLLDAAGLLPGERVLDFGCGGGIGSRAIARRIGPNGALTCLDVSAFWLGLCRKRLRRFDTVALLRGDIRNLPVPEDSFDLVFIHRVLRFIEEKDRAPVIEALAGKLRTGGRMLICEKLSPRLGFEAHLIRRLAAGAGLTEVHSGRNGSRFTVRFDKAGKAASDGSRKNGGLCPDHKQQAGCRDPLFNHPPAGAKAPPGGER